MQKIYTAPNLTLVEQMKAVLETEGIECVLKQQYLGIGSGEIPPMDCWPELWVVEDDQTEQALRLIEEEAPPAGDDWTCGKCGEAVEAHFGECWKCGAPRP